MDIIASTVKYIHQQVLEQVEDRASSKPIIYTFVKDGATSLAPFLNDEEKRYINQWNSGFGIRIVAYQKTQWFDNNGHLILVGSAGKLTHQDMTNRFKKMINANQAPVDIPSGFKRNELFPIICYTDDSFRLVASSDTFSPENSPVKGQSSDQKSRQIEKWVAEWKWLSRLYSTKPGETFLDGLKSTLGVS